MMRRAALMALLSGVLVAAQPVPEPLPLPPEPAQADMAPPAEPPPAAAPEAGITIEDGRQRRVVRGTKVVAGGAPWQIQLYTTLPVPPALLAADRALPPNDLRKRFFDRMERWERDHLCGGALIGDGWALTAAHCIVGLDEKLMWRDLKELRVRLGNVHLPSATQMAVDRVVVHRGYRRAGAKRHDIALLHLSADKATNPAALAQARPVGLPAPGALAIRPGLAVVATGWGITGENLQGSTRDIANAPLRGSADLLEAELAIVSPQDCRRIANYRPTLGPGVLCAVGATALRQDTCQGDSGGPLTRLGQLIGLVSTGDGCGRPGVPAIYTRVEAYADWIRLVREQSPPGRISRCGLVGRNRLECITS